MSADQLVRIGIIRHDVGTVGNLDRVHGIRRHANGAGKLHRAVFVRVLEADVQNGRPLAAIQTLFQLFFGDALDGHGAYSFLRLCLRQGVTGFAGVCVLADGLCGAPDDPTRSERKRARNPCRRRLFAQLSFRWRERSLAPLKFPTVRSLTTVDAPEEDSARLAGDSEVVTS